MRLLLILLAFAVSVDAFACPVTRSHKVRGEFMRLHPCPANGHMAGACPGFVVDHIVPLCASRHGDVVANMQWQTIADAHAKDLRERAYCSCLKAKGSQCTLP